MKETLLSSLPWDPFSRCSFKKTRTRRRGLATRLLLSLLVTSIAFEPAVLAQELPPGVSTLPPPEETQDPNANALPDGYRCTVGESILDQRFNPISLNRGEAAFVSPTEIFVRGDGQVDPAWELRLAFDTRAGEEVDLTLAMDPSADNSGDTLQGLTITDSKTGQPLTARSQTVHPILDKETQLYAAVVHLTPLPGTPDRLAEYVLMCRHAEDGSIDHPVHIPGLEKAFPDTTADEDQRSPEDLKQENDTCLADSKLFEQGAGTLGNRLTLHKPKWTDDDPAAHGCVPALKLHPNQRIQLWDCSTSKHPWNLWHLSCQKEDGSTQVSNFEFDPRKLIRLVSAKVPPVYVPPMPNVRSFEQGQVLCCAVQSKGPPADLGDHHRSPDGQARPARALHGDDNHPGDGRSVLPDHGERG